DDECGGDRRDCRCVTVHFADGPTGDRRRAVVYDRPECDRSGTRRGVRDLRIDLGTLRARQSAPAGAVRCGIDWTCNRVSSDRLVLVTWGAGTADSLLAVVCTRRHSEYDFCG